MSIDPGAIGSNVIAGLIVAAITAFFAWFFKLNWRVWLPGCVALLFAASLVLRLPVFADKKPDGPVQAQCAIGSLRIVGSSAFLPVAHDARDAYVKQCGGSAQISVEDGDSAFGLSTVQRAVLSNSPSAGSMIAMYDGIPSSPAATEGLAPHPMGVLILSIVAHSDSVPGLNVTTDELRRIFVDRNEAGWVAVGRRAGSGTRAAFNHNVLRLSGVDRPDDGDCPTPTGNAVSATSCTADGTAALLDFVDKTPKAIGYAAVAPPLNGFQQISVVNINGVGPSRQNVRDRSYGFWTIENLYTAAQPTALTKNFLEFLAQYREPNTPSYFVPCTDVQKALRVNC